MDTKDLKKLARFYRESPKDFLRASSNVLNTLAFETRKNDIKNLQQNLIIRNQRFLESSIQVEKAKSVKLDQQMAIVGSINRGHNSKGQPSFTGWKEQMGLAIPEKKRTSTTMARGGNRRGIIQPKYRLKSQSRIYKPEQFKGRNLKQQFGFMMRVLNKRGESQFLISHDIQTKRGVLGRGLYTLKAHKVYRVQTFKSSAIKQYRFRDISIKQLRANTNIFKVWQTSINHIMNKYK